jgi:hypothetical protein
LRLECCELIVFVGNRNSFIEYYDIICIWSLDYGTHTLPRMRNKLSIMEQRPLLRMRQLRIQSRRKRRPLRLPQKKGQRDRGMGAKQPMQYLCIHQPLQTRRTAKQKQNMAKKKTAVLHAKNNRVVPKQSGQPFFLFYAPSIQYC